MKIDPNQLLDAIAEQAWEMARAEPALIHADRFPCRESAQPPSIESLVDTFQQLGHDREAVIEALRAARDLPTE
jgi:hypothetical protein